jgi:hypothetical protein
MKRIFALLAILAALAAVPAATAADWSSGIGLDSWSDGS